MITLLDYGAGNVRSVINAIESLGETVKIVSRPEDILSADKLVFPGLDTLFLGIEDTPGHFTEVCKQCGRCVLGRTAAICPLVSVCEKRA